MTDRANIRDRPIQLRVKTSRELFAESMTEESQKAAVGRRASCMSACRRQQAFF
jgi:hypothetical protein